MAKIFIQENGKIRNLDDVELAEKVVEARKNKDPWEVIDSLLKVWAERAPDDEKSVMINVDQYRETQHDKVYAQTLHGKDQERRFTLAFPYSLQQMIRSQYKADVLPFDRDFFREFGRRYPAFKVAQKI